jgi:hypothetical protein
MDFLQFQSDAKFHRWPWEVIDITRQTELIWIFSRFSFSSLFPFFTMVVLLFLLPYCLPLYQPVFFKALPMFLTSATFFFALCLSNTT